MDTAQHESNSNSLHINIIIQYYIVKKLQNSFDVIELIAQNVVINNLQIIKGRQNKLYFSEF